MKKMLIVLIGICVLLMVFYFALENNFQQKSTYNKYCGACHLAPDPASLTQEVWEAKLLPDMMARLGYSYKKYDPYQGKSWAETTLLKSRRIYPSALLIPEKAAAQIISYILNLAPDSLQLLNTAERLSKNKKLEQFEPRLEKEFRDRIPYVTSLKYDEAEQELIISNDYGEYRTWKGEAGKLDTFSSPILSEAKFENTTFLTEVGILNPSELAEGKIYRRTQKEMEIIIRHLHRPVFSLAEDFDKDGRPELLVCEFGNHSGQFSLFKEENQVFKKQTLLPLAGTTRAITEDLDKDGKLDIIVQSTQGMEGVYFLFQQENLEFKAQKVISLPPQYGSSWFEYIDFDKDGLKDIIIVNGDNLDESKIKKPYHGLRIFINQGAYRFEEKFFYPIYGATRVIAEDFDQDADIDLAVLAFFPDFEALAEESFIYLENVDASNFNFQAYTTNTATKGRWLVMEKGDFDQDNDVDLVLGGFTLIADLDSIKNVKQWKQEKYELLFLENKLREISTAK